MPCRGLYSIFVLLKKQYKIFFPKSYFKHLAFFPEGGEEVTLSRECGGGRVEGGELLKA
jgi:hypothetical protein